MEKLFVDSDIIMDLLAERESFLEHALKLFSLANDKKVKLYSTAVIFANVFYLLRKINGWQKAKQQLKDLRELVSVLPVSEKAVDLSLNSIFSDFEDGLQYFTAKENKFSVLITRNIKDYKISGMKVMTAQTYFEKEQK